MSNSVPAIGIDLGTTYSCVGVLHNGKVQIIPNQEDGGDFTTPSYIFIDPDGEEVVGKHAKLHAFRNPGSTIYDVKRILGRNFTDPMLQEDMKFWPFNVQEHEGVPKVKVNGKLLHPEQISAKLLTRLSATADDFLGLPRGTVKKAVITVPAYFNDGQRQATVDAGELAGLEVLTILNEPTAAAFAYSAETIHNKPKKVLVFDLGGGTFDIAVLNMHKTTIDVLGVNGDTHLGGEDFDKNMMQYCAAEFKKETGLELLDGKDSSNIKVRDKARRNIRRLQTSCENTKQFLSVGVKAKVAVDGIINGEDLIVDMSREKFEELNMTLFEHAIDLVDETLKELNLFKKDIDDIVLVGGSTRIPKIQELLANYFDGKMLNKSIHPDHAVAYGAAVKAAMMTGWRPVASAHVDQVQEVTPMPVGIELENRKLSVVIPKNTKIPTRKVKEFTTSFNYQSSMLFPIYQGDDFNVAANNKLLGTFSLTGIPSRKVARETVELSMVIDNMGILHVMALCKSTNGTSSIVTVVEEKRRLSGGTKKGLMAMENSSPLK